MLPPPHAHHRKHRHVFKLSTLSMALLLAYPTFAQTTADTTTTSDEVAEVTLERMDVVVDQKDRYEKGKNEQFNNNIVTIYKDKDEVERFKGVNPADLLSGVAGVHSSDARNNGAISPNIRGLQGEGRIPVVVDGTRSEYTVYRGYAGVNNRTYVDPNLISEVRAYKGATELGHDMPQAVGGAVVMNTIDAKDVITGDKNWGVSVKYETNNNSITPKDVGIPYGQPYPTDETIAYGMGDMSLPLYKYTNSEGRNKFFDDHAVRIAVAGKNDLTDLMVAYSHRKQGNYFSGSNNGDAYKRTEGGSGLFGVAEYSFPGVEVTNTSSENESWLIKNNWYLPQGQKLKLSWRKTDIHYGEIMNSRSVYSKVLKDNLFLGDDTSVGLQWPFSEVKQQAGRLDYEWNPDDSKWLNLKAGLWFNNSKSQLNSSGGSIVSLPMNSYNDFSDIFFWFLGIYASCQHDMANIFDCKPTMDQIRSMPKEVLAERILNNQGVYKSNYSDDEWQKMIANFPTPSYSGDIRGNLINQAGIALDHKNTGLDLSNVFNLTDNLDLTVGLTGHRERLKGDFSDPQTAYDYNYQYLSNNYVFPPKSGERDEYRTWLQFDWQATPKLKIAVGGQWGNATLSDPKTDERLAQHLVERQAAQYYRDIPIKAKSSIDATPNRRDAVVGTYRQYADEDGFYKFDFPELEAIQYYDLSKSKYVSKPMTEEEKYAPLGKKKYHAFAPQFSFSYDINDTMRVYARYAEQFRFPSINENSMGFAQGYYGSIAPIYQKGFKTEESKNIEVGYVHDFTHRFPNLQHADIKVNYWYQRLHNVIDREYDSIEMTQYDRLTSRGLELQGRLDSGKYFADFGYSYLIDSKMCDSRQSYNNLGRRRHEDCYLGGYPGGYLRANVPPKHSLYAGFGVRLMDNKLTLGTRLNYQSMSNSKKQQQEGFTRLNTGVDAYVWDSYWTADAFVDYKPNENIKLSLIGTNLTDTYHPDALTRTAVPAPGRTIKLGVEYKF